jgi:Questin oxidase-like
MSAAAIQSRLASLSVNNKYPLAPLKVPTPTPLVTELLDKNDKEHDIYFGPNHFHNHFPHALLSQFALGAPESRLKKEWGLEDYLRPLGKKQPTEITDDNWKEYIGIDKYYHNYLDFFKEKIEKNGVQKTVLQYALDETLLPSFVSGAVHPLIHVGFGLEFNSDIVVAEGLAEACVHSPAFAPVVDVAMYSKPPTDKKSLVTIADEIRKDKSFENVVKFKDFPKSKPLLKSKPACDAIKNYVMKWSFDDTPEGLAKAYSELFELVTHFTVSSAFPPPYIINDPKYKGKRLRPLLDFFLMYCRLILN